MIEKNAYSLCGDWRAFQNPIKCIIDALINKLLHKLHIINIYNNLKRSDPPLSLIFCISHFCYGNERAYLLSFPHSLLQHKEQLYASFAHILRIILSL